MDDEEEWLDSYICERMIEQLIMMMIPWRILLMIVMWCWRLFDGGLSECRILEEREALNLKLLKMTNNYFLWILCFSLFNFYVII